MTTDTTLKCQIRWMIRKDMPDVVHISQECFDQPWTEQDFLTCLRQRNVIGMVADLGHEVAGFHIYELHKHKLRLLNLAVAPKYQRQRVGTQMLQRLTGKLSAIWRTTIELEVRESNLVAQKFFASCGFRAVYVFRDFYEDTGEDAFQFKFRDGGFEL